MASTARTGRPAPKAYRARTASMAATARMEDGLSVTSAAEPSGANCANGGSRFNSVSGTTFACNGANGTGGGLSGQDAITAVGTGSLIATTSNFVQVPGLRATVNVPADSILYISTDGGIGFAVAATTASASVAVDVVLKVDGTVKAGAWASQRRCHRVAIRSTSRRDSKDSSTPPAERSSEAIPTRSSRAAS